MTWTSGNTYLHHERWYHMYAEASGTFTGATTVFASGHVGGEDLHARLVSITLWSRGLSDAEVDDLASGGIGPDGCTTPSGRCILASYNAEAASASTISDTTGANADASIIGGSSSVAPLHTTATLPCIPNLGLYHQPSPLPEAGEA